MHHDGENSLLKTASNGKTPVFYFPPTILAKALNLRQAQCFFHLGTPQDHLKLLELLETFRGRNGAVFF